jgi:hypothetical protein
MVIIIPSYMIVVAPILWYFLNDSLWAYTRVLLCIHALASTLLILIGEEPIDERYCRYMNKVNKSKPINKTNIL